MDRLKLFIEANIPVAELKAEGLFSGIEVDEYEKIAAYVCEQFGFDSIYEYGQEGKNKYQPLEINYSELLTQPYYLN